jgi:two-component system, NtrC family, C4-dicarboxylate transport response regulator DctD
LWGATNNAATMGIMTFPVLVVDDDAHVHSLLDRVLQGERFVVAHAKTPEEALRLAAENSFQVALVDLHYAEGVSRTSAEGVSRTSAEGVSRTSADTKNGDIDPGGFALLASLRELDPTIELVVMSSSSRFDDVRGAMRSGASDYLAKGFGKGELLHTLMHALDRRRLRKIERRVRKESEAKGRLVGDSSAMREVRTKITKFGPAEAPVLITGETGTGKELVASALHAASADPSAPFVPVNCAALPASTIDSFFFGHEKGAFTGADRARGGIRGSRWRHALSRRSEQPSFRAAGAPPARAAGEKSATFGRLP